MKELDEKGFVFIGNDGCPYRCCMWGDRAWLFGWHSNENHWVSLRPVTQMDVWMFPRNLSQERQQHYYDAHEQWEKENVPDFTDTPRLPNDDERLTERHEQQRRNRRYEEDEQDTDQ